MDFDSSFGDIIIKFSRSLSFIHNLSIYYYYRYQKRTDCRILFSAVSTVSPATFSLTEIWQSFQDLISDVWSLEFILSLNLLLLIGVTAVHFYSIRQKTSKFHTKIRLDLHVNGLDCQCEMLNLKYPANYYTIDIHPAEFKINGGLFPRLYFEGAIKITDPAGQPVDFNNSISIPYCKIRTLKRILRDVRHTCLITLLDRKHHIVDVLLFQIKRENEAGILPGTSAPLYPSLTTIKYNP